MRGDEDVPRRDDPSPAFTRTGEHAMSKKIFDRFKVIDIDTHINEPMEAFGRFLADPFRARRPRIVEDTLGLNRILLEGKLYPEPRLSQSPAPEKPKRASCIWFTCLNTAPALISRVIDATNCTTTSPRRDHGLLAPA